MLGLYTIQPINVSLSDTEPTNKEHRLIEHTPALQHSQSSN